jgi:phage/plasmid-associated DNA primase
MVRKSVEKWFDSHKVAEDAEWTHIIHHDEGEAVFYSIPPDQIPTFHKNISPMLGSKCIVERVPEHTPAFFSFKIATDTPISDDILSIVAQVGISSACHYLHTKGVPEKICTIFRTEIHNIDEEPTENILFLFPRIIVDKASLKPIRSKVSKGVKTVAESNGIALPFAIETSITNTTPNTALLYGSAVDGTPPRRYYVTVKDGGDTIKMEEAYTERERNLRPHNMYSLCRLSGADAVVDASSEFETIATLVGMISAERAKDPSICKIIGHIIYHCSSGKALDIFETFMGSKKEASKIWYRVASSTSQWTIKTLRYLAKKDSPDVYDRYVQERIKDFMMRSTGSKGSHLDIARIMEWLWGHMFAVDKKDDWYIFSGSYWVIDGDVDMRNVMRDELIAVYEVLQLDLDAKARQAPNPERQKTILERAKRCGKIIKDLGSHAFKIALMKEAADLFRDKKMENLDGEVSWKLFAFADCVYDLDTYVLRDGLPEDYTMRHSNLNIRAMDFNDDHPLVVDLKEYLLQVYGSEEMVAYSLGLDSLLLEGGNTHKIFLLWEGPKGNNSKSMKEHMVRTGMGSYAAGMPTSAIVGGRRAEATTATPHLENAMGARAVFVQETRKGEMLTVAVIKELTSGVDPVTSRGIKEKRMKTVIPSFKPVLVVNNAPKMPPDDPAAFYRINLVQFLSQFLPKHLVPTTEEEQMSKRIFPIRKGFKEVIESFVAPYMWMMLEKHKELEGNKPEVPLQAAKAMEAYQLSNDVFLRFIMAQVEEEVSCGTMNLEDAYASFKTWYTNAYSSRPPIETDLEDYFSKRYGEPEQGSVWVGVRLRPKIIRKKE